MHTALDELNQWKHADKKFAGLWWLNYDTNMSEELSLLNYLRDFSPKICSNHVINTLVISFHKWSVLN